MSIAKSADAFLADIRVVVYREDDLYVAQCIEYDIATQAPDIEAVINRLELTIEAECATSMERGEKPFQGISPAPNYFHTLWEKRSIKLTRHNVPVDQHLPKFDIALARAA